MTLNKNLFRWVSIIVSFAIVSLILWNTYTFTQQFKQEERTKMEIWAKAFDDINSSDIGDSMTDLTLQVIKSNSTTPVIIMNSDGINNHNNIDEEKAKDSLYQKQLINEFKTENPPIELFYIDPKSKEKVITNTIYYGNSDLLKKMKYYPLALLLIILLFASVIYFFYKSNKNAIQNKLWAGMAKETAHQIGTPLSSLVGWLEILKMENVDDSTITEINKDITRLQTITDRFSKIGSEPKLDRLNIVEETEKTYNYLKSRSSKLIEFSFESSDAEIYANLNAQLFSWTIENLVKNAIDAMKGKGQLSINVSQLEDTVKIQVKDTGKGLAKHQFKKIFEPGHTTKKRGWGLGLSLARRIIEDYHNGRIKVLSSEINKGTTMQISIRTIA